MIPTSDLLVASMTLQRLFDVLNDAIEQAPVLTFGELIRDARKQAQRTGRKTAGVIGVSHVYLSEVELGTRCALAPEHWPALVAFLPSLTTKKLKAHADLDRVLRLARRAAEEIKP